MSTPAHQIPAELVQAELESVLASSTFARARGLANLLSYLCEKRLRGEADQIKEYTIAVEAYGRPADFQQKGNSIVRVEIKRLRDKLKHFYETEGAEHNLQIVIPVGQYTPIFQFRQTRSANESREPENIDPPAPDSIQQAESQEPSNRPDNPPNAPTVSAGISARAAVPRHRRLIWWGAGVGLVVAVLSLALTAWRSPGQSLEAQAGANPVLAPKPASETASTVNGAAPEPEEIRILAGMPSIKYVDHAGRIWSGDRYFNGGNTLRTNKPMIYRTLDPEIYHTGRHGDFSYDIPLQDGVYELRLHFAETVYGPFAQLEGGETSRLFAVMANGQPLLRPIDIISDADGDRTAEIKVFKDIKPSADGQLHLQFYSWPHSKALLNAIEILPAKPGVIRPIRFTTHDKPVFTGDGREWLPDSYFKGGRVLPRPGNITGVVDPVLYETERFGHFSYAIPVAPGRYTATLYFAERFFGPSNPNPAGKGPGSRVFHVFHNGEALLKNFDIFKEAGGMDRAIKRKFSGLTPNAQGKLLFEFKPVANYPLINAIEVVDEADRN